MVAITGANGLLGSSVLEKFLSEKIPVVGLKRANSDLPRQLRFSQDIVWREADVTNSLSLAESLKKIDTVIHTAAVVSFDPRSKDRIFQTNVIGTQHVVDACLALGIPRLIFISSVAALGRKKGNLEINEENKWVDSDLNSDYAKSKYLAELEIYRGQEEGLSIAIVNPSVILARANPYKSSAQLFNYVNEERLFYIDSHINVVDVRDVTEIIFKIYSNNVEGEKVIANAGPIRLKELLSNIATRLNKKEPTVKLNPKMLMTAAWLEEMRCRLTGREAAISRQSVRASREKFIYQNHKSINRLNMAYKPLDETLDWCCEYYRDAFTTNK